MKKVLLKLLLSRIKRIQSSMFLTYLFIRQKHNGQKTPIQEMAISEKNYEFGVSGSSVLGELKLTDCLKYLVLTLTKNKHRIIPFVAPAGHFHPKSGQADLLQEGPGSWAIQLVLSYGPSLFSFIFQVLFSSRRAFFVLFFC